MMYVGFAMIAFAIFGLWNTNLDDAPGVVTGVVFLLCGIFAVVAS